MRLRKLRTKILLAFFSIIAVFSLSISVIGFRLIENNILDRTRTKVSYDLNSAREIYKEEMYNIGAAVRFTAERFFIKDAILNNSVAALEQELEKIRKAEFLDLLSLTDEKGEVIIRSRNPSVYGDSQAQDKLVRHVLTERESIATTVIMTREELSKEGEDLVEQSHIELIPTPKAKSSQEKEQTSGMLLKAVSPVLGYDGEFIGVLYGGNLLNRDYKIIDKVNETVYQGIRYKGKDIGTVTIFQGDVRISTNVITTDGNRAIGTRVSSEVYDQVLIKEEPWVGRAFVVNDWYITAYEPIADSFGEILGMLYVGVLEAEYRDIRRNTLLILFFVTAVGSALAIIFGYVIGQQIYKPVQQLIEISKDISNGDFSQKIDVVSDNELGLLQNTFKKMISSLKEREEYLRAESEFKLLRSEKEASVGRLAAGVAHEINNPLTGVLTFTHMLLRREDLEKDVRKDLETIAESSERVRKIVKGLLDFSRQGSIEAKPTDINKLISETISLVTNQVLLKGISLDFNPGEEIPTCVLDRSQFQGVLMNLFINSIDATDRGGHINLSTRFIDSTSIDSKKGIEIVLSDTGCGISPEDLEKIFDPFFTTKDVGQGTGLGLSISKGILERHGGSIRVESEVGKGSIFTILLPLFEGNHDEYSNSR